MQHNYFLSLLLFIGIQSVWAHDKPMVIVIPSYNNQQWYKQNLDSVFCQKYNNYRVIYINDCSSDGTGELVDKYIEESGMSGRVLFTDNTVRCGALANLYRAIHSCDDHEIVITLDGDDWFTHDRVLERINQEYQDENVWLTYGQFKTHPQNTVGFCRAIPPSIVQGNLFREYEWITSHPRTFYAALFKQVSLKDLLYERDFFDVTWDMAFMYPMLEMASGHSVFISDVMYAYNQGNPLNDFRQKVARQIRCKYHVSSKQKYTRIPTPFNHDNHDVDVILFSEKTPAKLLRCLELLEQYLDGIEHITVLYQDDAQTKIGYNDIRRRYSYITFCEATHESFKQDFMGILASDDSSYVLLVHDTMGLHDFCDIRDCAAALKQTKAHACYLARGKDSKQHMPLMVPVFDGMYAWQFKYAGFDFKRAYTADMALYKKSMLKEAIERLDFADVSQMMRALNDDIFDYENVGLCFEHAKAKRN